MARTRAVYERCLAELDADELAQHPDFFIHFARFEERVKEMERARAIYKAALESVPKALAGELYRRYTAFEKQFGSLHAVEDVVLSKRRFQYEEELKSNPYNYDVWFDYLRLEENAADSKTDSSAASAAAIPAPADIDRIRDLYERAIAVVPPVMEKQAWLRYIYLWINYAIFEELAAQVCGAAFVYTHCISVIMLFIRFCYTCATGHPTLSCGLPGLH